MNQTTQFACGVALFSVMKHEARKRIQVRKRKGERERERTQRTVSGLEDTHFTDAHKQKRRKNTHRETR